MAPQVRGRWLGLIGLACVLVAGGCAQHERPTGHTISKLPPRDALVEAVPIWVSSSVVSASGTTPVFVELDQNAGVDEPIVIMPMLAPGAPAGTKLEDVLDLTGSRWRFTIPSGDKVGNTTITAKRLPTGSPPVTVWLVVPDNKNANTALGTLVVQP